MPKIKVNDIELYYETYGQGEPLIFIAGFGADHTIWNPVSMKLKENYQVIVFDNRGAGRSDVPQGSYSIEQMSDDVFELCHQLGINRAHFIGNSMGGYILQMLAYQHPTLVKSAIISNSSTSTHCGFHIYADAQFELRKAQAPITSLIKASCSWAFSYNFLSQLGRLNDLIELNLTNPYPFTLTGYAGQYAALDKFDSSTWVEQIKVPTLVISGDQDLIFPEPLVKLLADQIPNAEYYSFTNCGHLPFIEHPEQFVAVVRAFIQ